MGNCELAISTFEISLSIMKDIDNQEGVMKAMNSIGDSLMRLFRFKEAQKVFNEAIKIKHSNEIYKGIIQYNISEVHYNLNEFEEAEKSLKICLKIGKALDFDLMFVYSSWLQGRIELKKMNYDKAIKLLKYALKISIKINSKDRTFNILEDLGKLYEIKGDLKLALKYYKDYLKIKEEVINEESAKIIKTIEHKNEVIVLKKEKEIEQNKNNELQKAYSEIEFQRNEIEAKSKEITDSIRYAKRIQEAILPSDAYIKKILPESFVIYQPKDILSGDFYWISNVVNDKNEDLIVVAVADCTGHGVPGALLSIVGNNYLRLCEVETTVNSPSEALNFLNRGVNDTLRQQLDESTIKDGMDISFISINKDDLKVYFSGAKTSFYIVRDKNIIETKGDKHPVGSFLGEELKPFTNHELDLKTGDQLYLFTDGFADQFGGPLGKKFKYQSFKKLLISVSDLSMKKQKEEILKTFKKWKGHLEQVDDVCVFSVKI